MSASYGHAIVEFPGFPPLRFQTIDDVMRPPRSCGRYRELCARSIQTAKGSPMRLSKKERSRITTFVKKWNKRTRNISSGRGWIQERIRPYKTTEDLRDW